MDIDDASWPSKYHRLELHGHFEITCKDKSGNIFYYQEGKNLITTAGENLVAKLLDFNGSENAPEYLAFGSGTDDAQKTDTQLQAEIADTRVSADSSLQSGNTIKLTYEITTAGTYTIEEMGILNAATLGTLFSRFLTQPLSVVPGFLIDITWTLTITGID